MLKSIWIFYFWLSIRFSLMKLKTQQEDRIRRRCSGHQEHLKWRHSIYFFVGKHRHWVFLPVLLAGSPLLLTSLTRKAHTPPAESSAPALAAVATSHPARSPLRSSAPSKSTQADTNKRRPADRWPTDSAATPWLGCYLQRKKQKLLFYPYFSFKD